MSDTKTVLTDRKPWQFAPGNNANPTGRPKGARSKLGEDFLSALQKDFEANGIAVIAEVRETKPHEYLKVVASLLPKQVELKEGTFDGFSDEQLTAIAVAARSALGLVESNREGDVAEGKPN